MDGTHSELPGSDAYARFVGLAVRAQTNQFYWSDSRVIKRATINASVHDTANVIGTLARVTWFGVNFGQHQSELLALTIKGVTCVSVLSWSPEVVECLVGLPQRFDTSSSSPAPASESDCTIRTTRGSMTGIALNYGDMVASGYPSPIVKRIEIDATFILPHALALDDDNGGHPWMYWSNSADGKIYRSSLVSTALEIVQENVWSVRGMAIFLGALPSSPTSRKVLFYSLESKGSISYKVLESSGSTAPGISREFLSGLRSPRGLAIDSTAKMLYFTEKTGRIYKSPLALDTTGSAHNVLTMSSLTRLDGIAVDSKYENCIVRSHRSTNHRVRLIGTSTGARRLRTWSLGLR